MDFVIVHTLLIIHYAHAVVLGEEGVVEGQTWRSVVRFGLE